MRSGESRVGANTGWLYLRLAIETATELVVVRILLSTFGTDGYGLYAAVSGAIGLFGFFFGALESAARRFLCSDSHNAAPLLGLTVLVAFVLVAVGVFSAFAIFPFAAAVSLPVLGVLVIRLLRIPYETCVVASERMGFFFFASVLESVLSLVAALVLVRLPFEPLRAYVGLRLIVSLLAGGVVVGYALRCHVESRVRPLFRLDALKGLLTFFGWSALGSVSGLLKGNGIVVLLAAYASAAGCGAWDISMKIGVFVWGLIANYRMAYLPAIVKSWTEGRRPAFVRMTVQAFRNSIVGSVAICLPILVFSPALCRLWLGPDVPDALPMFLRMVALQFFFEALATPLDTAILAAGRIACYEIVLTVLLGASFFLAWLFLSMGLPPWTTTGAVAVVNALAFVFRLFYRRFVLLPDGTRAWSCHNVF